MTNSITRKQIVQATKALQRPEGVSPTRWRGVHAYLMAIAGYYPKAFPSQERLAGDLGCDVRSIRRYQVLCQHLGLLHVTADAGAKGKHNTWSKTHWYHIFIQDNLSGLIPDKLSYKVPSARFACLQHDASLSHSASERTQPGPPSAGSNVVLMQSREERSSQAPRNRAPQPRKTGSKKKTPEGFLTKGAQNRQDEPPPAKKLRWRALAEYFTLQWLDLQSHPANRDLRGIRDVESSAQCKAYIDAHFQYFTDDEVRAHIDEFMRLVSQRRVTIKGGQSAWLCFTGAWGRNRKGRGDFAADRKANREYVPPQWRAK